MVVNSFNELVRTLKERVNIVDIVEKLNIPISIRGQRKRVLCPFHDDNDPSMEIFKENYYHCWTCNAHGDIFELVKHYKGINFKDSVVWLAEIYGMSIPSYSIVSNALKRGFQNGLELGYAIYKKKSNLAQLKRWCQKRDIDINTIKSAGILSVNRNPIISFSKGSGKELTRQEWGALEDSGLIRWVRQKEKDANNGTYLDLNSVPKDTYWYKSIHIPIYDENKKIVGYAVRENEDKKFNGPKYLYNKGFKRSENLYGIDKVFKTARDLVGTSRRSIKLKEPFRLFLTEGFMDTLRLVALDFNAASVLGNSLTGNFDDKNSQVTSLKKLGDSLRDIPLYIHLFFDNDSAGRQGMLRALKRLLPLQENLENFYFDVIVPSSDSAGKDPDELLIEFKDRKSAQRKLESWSRSLLDFVISSILECHIDEIENEWISLNEMQKAQLIRKVYSFLPEKEKTYCSSTYGPIKAEFNEWEILFLQEDEKITRPKILGDEANQMSVFSFQKALNLAENSYNQLDFPIDLGSWDRLKKASNILIEELNIHLRSGIHLEPLIPMLHPRDGGGNPRLLAIPCVEDLILQEYVLNTLLTYAIEDADTIPAVIHKPSFDNEQIITVGCSAIRPQHTVSFAYQVNASTIKEGGGIRNVTFRHFSECWRSFNNFVLNRVSKAPITVLFPSRLDIKRFYDEIPQYAVIDALTNALTQACELRAPLIPGIDPSDSNSTNRAKKIREWILKMSFGYKFYSPEDGTELQWPSTQRGIPQGPNLSAWLANIVLFSIDKRMCDEVERINEEYRSKFESNESSVVATYARYVDDVILISHDRTTLLFLQQLFASEINKIGLTLSPKTSPLEPQELTVIKDWLLENRGMGGRPSGPWDYSLPLLAGGIFRTFYLKNIDRKFALALLHDNDLDREDFNVDELRNVLETVCQKTDDIRYRDYRSIAKRIWQMIGDSCSINDDIDKIRELFIIEWNKLIKLQKEMDPPNDSHSNIIESYREPTNKIWPIFSWLEGIQALLASRLDRAVFVSSQSRKMHEERRNKIAFWTLKGLLENLVERSGIEDVYIRKFYFLIDLRRMTLIQIAKTISPDIDGQKELTFMSDLSTESGSARFSLRTIPIPNTERYLRIPNHDSTFHVVLLFHEVVERLSRVMSKVT